MESEEIELRVVEEKVDKAFNAFYKTLFENFNTMNFKNQKKKILNAFFDYSLCALGMHDEKINLKFYSDPIVKYIKENFFEGGQTFGSHKHADRAKNKNSEVEVNLSYSNLKKSAHESFNTILHECVHEVNEFKNLYIDVLNNNEMTNKKYEAKSFKGKISYFSNELSSKIGVSYTTGRMLYLTSENEMSARLNAGELTISFLSRLLEKASADKDISSKQLKWIKKQIEKEKESYKKEKTEINEAKKYLIKNANEIASDIMSKQNEIAEDYFSGKKKLKELLVDFYFTEQTRLCFNPELFKKIYKTLVGSNIEQNFFEADILISYLGGSIALSTEVIDSAQPYLKNFFKNTLEEKCPEKIPYSEWCKAISSEEFYGILKEKYGSEDAVKLLTRSVMTEKTFNEYFSDVLSEEEKAVSKNYRIDLLFKEKQNRKSYAGYRELEP